MRIAVICIVAIFVGCGHPIRLAPPTRVARERTVTVTRVLGTYVGVGVVVTNAHTLDTPTPHAAFAAARAWLEVASAALQDDPALAVNAVRNGMTELDCECKSRHSHQLAWAAEHEDTATAARLLMRALHQRLDVYARQFYLSVIP
jgi:hypothetical protein